MAQHRSVLCIVSLNPDEATAVCSHGSKRAKLANWHPCASLVMHFIKFYVSVRSQFSVMHSVKVCIPSQ